MATSATPGSAPSIPASQRSVSVVLRPRSAANEVITFTRSPDCQCMPRLTRSRYWAPCRSDVLNGVRTPLSGSHPHDSVDWADPDLPVADPAGLGRLGDDAEQILGVLILAENLDADLGH